MQLRKQLDEVPVALRVIISGTPIQVSRAVLMPAGMPRWHLLGSCWGWPLTRRPACGLWVLPASC
jgi:hypothetical protein